MLKLYGGIVSRATIVQWYLEELQVPYEFVQLDLQAGEHQQPEFLEINPMGKVPAIEDEGFKLWESGAILLYLAQKHGKMPSSIQQQAEIYQWILFANSTLSSGIFNETSREKETPQLLQPLNTHLQQYPYLMGTEFSVVDVAVGSVLSYLQMMFELDYTPYPGIIKYVKEIMSRPAFQKIMAQRQVNED
ncbi:MAG: glutathione S-transferase family protein [Microcoleaceae cyanobacterium]